MTSIPKNTQINTTSAYNHEPGRIIFPLLPKAGQDNKFELEVFDTFISHLREVPNSRVEIKILSSIHFTADTLEASDALIAKTLVDMGLRAPRKAFPVSFLDFVDRAVMRKAWDQSTPAASVMALKEHWDYIGEDRFAAGLQVQYAVYNEGLYATA